MHDYTARLTAANPIFGIPPQQPWEQEIEIVPSGWGDLEGVNPSPMPFVSGNLGFCGIFQSKYLKKHKFFEIPGSKTLNFCHFSTYKFRK